MSEPVECLGQTGTQGERETDVGSGGGGGGGAEGGCCELMMSMKPPHLHQNVIRGRMDSELTR